MSHLIVRSNLQTLMKSHSLYSIWRLLCGMHPMSRRLLNLQPFKTKYIRSTNRYNHLYFHTFQVPPRFPRTYFLSKLLSLSQTLRCTSVSLRLFFVIFPPWIQLFWRKSIVRPWWTMIKGIWRRISTSRTNWRHVLRFLVKIFLYWESSVTQLRQNFWWMRSLTLFLPLNSRKWGVSILWCFLSTLPLRTKVRHQSSPISPSKTYLISNTPSLKTDYFQWKTPLPYLLPCLQVWKIIFFVLRVSLPLLTKKNHILPFTSLPLPPILHFSVKNLLAFISLSWILKWSWTLPQALTFMIPLLL